MARSKPLVNPGAARGPRAPRRVPPTHANGSGPILDLDARRAETDGSKTLVVKVNGQAFHMPARLTLWTLRQMGRVARLADSNDPQAQLEMLPMLDALIEDLFGTEAEAASKVITLNELMPILQFYGVTAGESLASGAI